MAQSKSDDERWERLIDVAAEFGLRHPDAVLVGGTVAAFYAGHRISLDADFVLTDLRARFDQLVSALESDPDWVTARLKSPVLILRKFKGVETGLRQLRRGRPLETTRISIRGKHLRIPTLAETLRIKGWLAVSRNSTRDYLGLAALSAHTGFAAAARALADLDGCYQDVYRPDAARDVSIALQLARQLVEPAPYDFDTTDLPNYKRLDARWQDWSSVRTQLRALAVALTELVIQGADSA